MTIMEYNIMWSSFPFTGERFAATIQLRYISQLVYHKHNEREKNKQVKYPIEIYIARSIEKWVEIDMLRSTLNIPEHLHIISPDAREWRVKLEYKNCTNKHMHCKQKGRDWLCSILQSAWIRQAAMWCYYCCCYQANNTHWDCYLNAFVNPSPNIQNIHKHIYKSLNCCSYHENVIVGKRFVKRRVETIMLAC